MRVPWTARRSNQSILKEISPGISSVTLNKATNIDKTQRGLICGSSYVYAGLLKSDSSSITLNDSTLAANIYGGAKANGADAVAEIGKSSLTINSGTYSRAEITKNMSLHGGSEAYLGASVSTGEVVVDFKGGTVNANIFGAGLAESEGSKLTVGKSTVNMSGGTFAGVERGDLRLWANT